MSISKSQMKLYVVTDRSWLDGKLFTEEIEKTLQGGATLIQLREKNLFYDEFLKEGKEIKKITDKYNIPLIINDNVEIAMNIDASGVHIGQSDMDAAEVKKRIGKDKILGVTAKTVEQAIKAEKDGASYIGVGAAFSTSTKLDTRVITFETIKNICKSVTIPVVAIGGIDENNIMNLKGLGIHGVALVSSIFSKEDVLLATKQMLELTECMLTQ
ncbi:MULTISPECIES: thiamine phosphate synthase [unclassified Clostridium]|uniref:thiamine phosphate synthase n=1 Tax=unclassified Clostridium TaxID=2614128 RepID=UPI000E83C8E7|nr:thiamine phosphate synthase [Clostridium sp.]